MIMVSGTKTIILIIILESRISKLCGYHLIVIVSGTTTIIVIIILNIQRGIRIQQTQSSSSSTATATTTSSSSSNRATGKRTNTNDVVLSSAPPPSTSSCIVLELRNIKFSDSGIPILDGIIGQPQYYQIPTRSIDLQNNLLSDIVSKALANLLPSLNTSCLLSCIQSIDLRYNDISDDGIIALVHVLVPSKSLRTFNIGYTGINVRGAKTIAYFIRNNESVVDTYLGNNHSVMKGLPK